MLFDSLVIPEPVRRGGHVRIVSPAMPVLSYVPERARRAERVLTGLGFTVSYGRHAWLISDDGTTAGTRAQRAADLMEAFEDPSVDVILAAEAGLGSREVLDLLDPAAITANPKPFSGYCDNVFLNFYLASAARLSSLYGCTLMKHLGEAHGPYPETIDYLERSLASSSPLTCSPVAARTGEQLNWYDPELEARTRPRNVAGGWTWLRPGFARGTFLGGEITLIPELVRCFGLRPEAAVLFWDVAYHGLPVRQLFGDACASMDLTSLAGMVVGAHPTTAPAAWATAVDDLLGEFLPGIGYPVVVNADLSHLCPSWTVPFGEEAVLDSAAGIVFPRRRETVVRVGAGVLHA
jgi:muramoyltetrapeptide carboxypeptidase